MQEYKLRCHLLSMVFQFRALQSLLTVLCLTLGFLLSPILHIAQQPIHLDLITQAQHQQVRLNIATCSSDGASLTLSPEVNLSLSHLN
ncbi:hypothetical protein FGO68_gene8321 [Halteria grandinella]|uniref:Uncharacterized protein n=1 Tax=Halteria grandinella TaxID=5974 RepID=A0A8J8ND97_HALGN|nr:hypothetical protein FGO68_gene8321 [Halteria grandinella]